MFKTSFAFLLFYIFLTPSLSAQSKPVGELGLGLGGSYYLGDLNKVPFVNTHFAANLFYRHTYNYRFASKIEAQYGTLSAEGNDFQGTLKTLNNKFVDLSILGEFNFRRFMPANKKFDYTPYIATGVGVLFTLGDNSNKYLNLPFGGGIRFNLKNDIIVGAEMLMKNTFNDKLDNIIPNPEDGSGNATGRQVTYDGNKDWYSVFSINVAFKIKYEEKCPAIH